VLAAARPLIFAKIEPAVAVVRGVPVTALGVLLLALLGAAAAEATQAVGAPLLLGLLAAPAGAAHRARFHHYNTDIALQCYEFVVCSPGRRARLHSALLAPSRPAVRFHTAPGVRGAPDGSRSPMGDVIHMRIPSRAVDAD
jgi:hypothetical protein